MSKSAQQQQANLRAQGREDALNDRAYRWQHHRYLGHYQKGWSEGTALRLAKEKKKAVKTSWWRNLPILRSLLGNSRQAA